MLTLTRVNTCTPARRTAYWPFTDDLFRPFAEMINSPMRTSVKETEDAYLFDAELPGFEPNEIDLSVQDGVISLIAEHKEGREDAPTFAGRSVRRSFTVDGVDEEHIAAEYKNGILRVTLPKAKAPEVEPARRIEIR